ncbi:hypothetical protein L6R52_17360, partial [Myxococcota bacterium]|nr:hypothetical protein [Myxococcota bacterium]
EGPRDPGRASYQIAVDVCPSCKTAHRTSDGASTPIDESTFAMACCDAEVVELRLASEGEGEPSPSSTSRSQRDAITDARPRATPAPDPQQTAPRPMPRATQTIPRPMPRATQTAPRPMPRATQTVPRPMPRATQTAPRPMPRATQTVPPATRRFVLRRDRGRCVVPGCSHATFVDLHHVTPRSEGGTHDPDGLATLCGAHHTAIHEGRISIEGRASTGFIVRHADGTGYGGDVVTRSQGVMADVFLALRALGFRETESRRALAATHTHVGTNANFEDVLRAALAALRADA